MAINSKIQWTDHTWNPWYGCPDDGKRSPACDHCYARSWAKRSGIVNFDREIQHAGAATFRAPLNRKKYKPGDRVFVCSLSDFFHDMVAQNWMNEAWGVMAQRPDLTWIILTKRPDNIRVCENWPDGDAWENVWLGVTVEQQEQADARISKLLATPASVRFVSVEPMLRPVDLSSWTVRYPSAMALNGLPDDAPAWTRIGSTSLNWVICGGESGPGARPMHPDWVRSLRDQCQAAGVPFFFKQWGEWAPNCLCDRDQPCRTIPRPEPGKLGVMFRCGKEQAGDLIDERGHHEWPVARG